MDSAIIYMGVFINMVWLLIHIHAHTHMAECKALMAFPGYII